MTTTLIHHYTRIKEQNVVGLTELYKHGRQTYTVSFTNSCTSAGNLGNSQLDLKKLATTMDTHKVPISKTTSINNISHTISFFLTYNCIKQSHILPHWRASVCSTATCYVQSFQSIISLQNFIKCIHNEIHVHINYLIIILLQTICTGAMCEPQWGHPEYIKIIPNLHAGYFHQAP